MGGGVVPTPHPPRLRRADLPLKGGGEERSVVVPVVVVVRVAVAVVVAKNAVATERATTVLFMAPI